MLKVFNNIITWSCWLPLKGFELWITAFNSLHLFPDTKSTVLQIFYRISWFSWWSPKASKKTFGVRWIGALDGLPSPSQTNSVSKNVWCTESEKKTFIYKNNSHHTEQRYATYKFVYFIEQKNGIANADVFQSLDNTTRHWTNVRPTVTTDVRLVTDATECYSKTSPPTTQSQQLVPCPADLRLCSASLTFTGWHY